MVDINGCEYEYAMLPNPYIGENAEELKRQFNLFLSNAIQRTQCVKALKNKNGFGVDN